MAKLAAVVGEQVCVGNGVDFKLGGKNLSFNSFGPIKHVRGRDLSNRGVVRSWVSCDRGSGVWVSGGGGGGGYNGCLQPGFSRQLHYCTVCVSS